MSPLARYLAAFLACGAQAEVRVASSLEPGVLKLGDDAVLRVEVSGTEDAQLGPLPEVKGLALRRFGASARSERIQIVDRIRSRWVSLTFAIRVTPEAEGEYEVPPIRVLVAGRAFETKPHRLEVIRDFRGAALGFLEVAGPPRRVWRGEVFRVEATFGIRADLVQARAASEPALRAPWAAELPDAVRLPLPELARDAAQQIGLNGEPALVSRVGSVRRGAASFVAWRLAVPYVASFPGRIAVGKTFFLFERVLRPGFGLFDPGERERLFLDAPGFEVAVEELPEEGRPEGFGGAVGSFRVEAAASTRDVRVGESVRFTLTIAGPGNVEFLESPDLERAPGFERFRFFGRLDEKGEGKRQSVYDLAPLGEDASTLPSVAFPYFDPESGEYRTARTEPIPLRVRPLPPGERLADLPGGAEAPAPKDELRDAKPIFFVPPSPSGGDGTAAAAAVAPPLVWFGVLLLRARGRRRERDPAGWRRRRAATVFRDRIARVRTKIDSGVPREACGELARAVAGYLADREGTSAEAVIGADVYERMRSRGEPEALAKEFASLLEVCDRATFSGLVGRREGRGLLDRAVELVSRLEKEARGR